MDVTDWFILLRSDWFKMFQIYTNPIGTRDYEPIKYETV